MEKFISELFFGNIDPQMRGIKKGSPIEKQMNILVKNEELLTDRLYGDTKTLFLQYVDAYSQVLGTCELDSFVSGFRLGANCIFDVFVSTDSTFEKL